MLTKVVEWAKNINHNNKKMAEEILDDEEEIKEEEPEIEDAELNTDDSPTDDNGEAKE